MILEELSMHIEDAKFQFYQKFVEPLDFGYEEGMTWVNVNCVIDVNPDRVRCLLRDKETRNMIKRKFGAGSGKEVMTVSMFSETAPMVSKFRRNTKLG